MHISRLSFLSVSLVGRAVDKFSLGFARWKMTDQTLTPLRSKKRPTEATPKRRFSFSFADTSKLNLKSENKNSPQFARLLSPKNWRLSRTKHVDRHAHDSTDSLPDIVQQNSFEVTTSLPTILDKTSRYTLRVYASDLHPDILYKTITITATTTALEALQLFLKKYAVDEEDRDPSKFNLAEVNETNKGNYFRTLKDDECLLQVQCNWVKASEWSFWLIRKETDSSPTLELQPTYDNELEIPIDVSYLNRELSVLTVSMTDVSTCAEVIEKVLDKFKLTEERCDDYSLWEMMGDGDQMTGTPLMLDEKVLANKTAILSGETTLFLRPQNNGDSRCASPADLDRIFGANLPDSETLPCAWISNTPPSHSQEDNEQPSIVPWTKNEIICDEVPSMETSTATQRVSDKPQIVHSFSEPYLLSESSKSDIETVPRPKISEKIKPVITVTGTGSTGTSSNCSTESMAESSQTNSTASETLQTFDSPESSTTEVDIVQENRSPCLTNPVRVRIQYPCSLYQDANYLPPKKLSNMIQEMIKDGMPRLMKKIVEETKLAYKKPTDIFNFDGLVPQKQDATPAYSTTDAANKNDIEEAAGSVSKENEIPAVDEIATVVNTSSTLSKPPDESHVSQTLSSDSPEPSDDEQVFSDNNETHHNTSPKKRSMTLPPNVTGLVDDNKLQRSNSLMSEQRRMEILRNMSQSVKDRLRRHSSSATASSTPNSLDRYPASTSNTSMSNTTTRSCSSSPTHYSVNISISNTVSKPQQSQADDEPFVPSSKNKVKRWISFNYGDKAKSQTAQKYMKHLEQRGND